MPMSIQQFRARLLADNPWWAESSRSGAEFAPPEERRLYFGLFRAAVEGAPAGKGRLLMGGRRLGKSVMIRQLVQALIQDGFPARRVILFSLRSPVYYGCTLKDCLGLLMEDSLFQSLPRQYVIFDDIQYVKGWERELHALARAYPNSIFLGASSVRPQPDDQGKTPSLAVFTLPPLSFAEYMRITRNDDLLDPPDRALPGGPFPTTRNIQAVNRHFLNYLRSGCYPEAVFSWEARRHPGRFASGDILPRVLLTDVPDLYGVGEIKELNRLFCCLALNMGRETSQNRLRKTADLAKNTMRRYLEHLEESFLLYHLKRVDEENKDFMRERALKLYPANPSLYCALFSPEQEGEEPYSQEVMAELVRAAVYCQFPQGTAAGQVRYARRHGGEVECLFLPRSRTRGGSGGIAADWFAALPWADDPASRPDVLRSLAEYAALHGLRNPGLFVTRSQSGPWQGPDGQRLEMLPAALFCHGLSDRIFAEKE